MIELLIYELWQLKNINNLYIKFIIHKPFYKSAQEQPIPFEYVF